MCAVTLINAVLEHVRGIEAMLPNIIEFFIKELSQAKQAEYKNMLLTGLCMCFWYSAPVTLQSLEAINATETYLSMMFAQIEGLKHDFEIKKFTIGFASILQTDPSQVPQSVQNLYGSIMKALVYLCQKSIVVYEKQLFKQKEEEATEENVEQGIYDDDEVEVDIDSDEENDEDYVCEEYADKELYDSKLDEIDEVIFFRDTLTTLETQNAQMYAFLLGCLDNNDQANLQTAIQKAIQYQAQTNPSAA